MNGEINNALKEELLTAYMIAGFRRFLVYGFENDPSDAELEEMFPDERKHIRLGKKYVRLEKAVEKRRSEPNSFTLYLKRAAVIVMTVVSLTTAVMMTDTNVRAAVEHAVVEFFDKYAKINFSYSEEEVDETKGIYDLTINYIPPNYVLKEWMEESDYRSYDYYNSVEDKYLSISIGYSNSTESDVDSEHTEMTEITVGKYKGYLFYNETEKSGSIIFGDKNIMFSLGGYFSKEELMKIAQSIK